MPHVVFALPALYLIARYVAPLAWLPEAKIALSAVLLVASQYHLWSRLSSGSMFCPEFPRPLIILFNWAFGTILLLTPMQLSLDLASVLASAAGFDLVIPDLLRCLMGLAATVLAAFGVRQAIRVPSLRDVEVGITDLPDGFEGYTILQLTDLHISRLFPASWADAVVRRSNALGVDLVVVTGDLIDGSIAARRADVEPLRHLRAIDGVYVVPGNHEYFFGHEAWMRHFAALGMRPLENGHALLARGGDSLVLAGVTDLSASGVDQDAPDLDAALRDSPPGSPVILLDHQPRQARAASARGVALQLSGHTHGGLIAGLDRLFARANGGFVSGSYLVGDMTLYVSNGTALWPGCALRLGRPSELTRITLRGRDTRSPIRHG